MPIDSPPLSSVQNAHVKHARSLKARKIRQRERAFLVEGVRLFLDALDANADPQRVFFDPDATPEPLLHQLEALDSRGIAVHPSSNRVIRGISDTETPQGIVAIFSVPHLEIDFRGRQPLLVVADGLKDPGNLGTLMRAALGAGVDALYFSANTTDPFSPKVVRAAMGTHFRLPLRFLDWSSPPDAISRCEQIVMAEASATKTYDAVNWRNSTVLVVGSETGGISGGARDRATMSVSIPLAGGLESLNAAIAGAVILFEAARCRRTQ